MNDVNAPMLGLGLFLMAAGAGTTDNNGNQYSLSIGIILGLAGLALMFFSAKEMRNPNRLRRLARSIWGYLRW